VIRHSRIIRTSAARITRAANRTIDDLSDRLVEQEPDLTGRLLGRIAHAMDGFQTKGVKWTSKVLTAHGPGAQEKEYGADFLGVLEINLPHYAVRKGFLAQAKLVEPLEGFSSGEFTRMKEQCERMLELSPDSFVFHYSSNGIRVIPATAVVGSIEPNAPFDPRGVYSRSVATFYEDHFASFIGDPRISEPTIETLERLRTHRLLYLLARQ